MEKKEAVTDGAAMMVQLNDPAWKLRTWENLGWHYDAVHPCGMSVNPVFYDGGKVRYFAMLAEDGKSDEAYWPKTDEDYETPQEAVWAKTKSARAFLAGVQALVEAAEEIQFGPDEVRTMDGRSLARNHLRHWLATPDKALLKQFYGGPPGFVPLHEADYDRETEKSWQSILFAGVRYPEADELEALSEFCMIRQCMDFVIVNLGDMPEFGKEIQPQSKKLLDIQQ